MFVSKGVTSIDRVIHIGKSVASVTDSELRAFANSKVINMNFFNLQFDEGVLSLERQSDGTLWVLNKTFAIEPRTLDRITNIFSQNSSLPTQSGGTAISFTATSGSNSLVDNHFLANAVIPGTEGSSKRITQEQEAELQRLDAESKRLSADAQRLNTDAKRLGAESKRLNAYAEWLVAEKKRLKDESQRINVANEIIISACKKLEAENQRVIVENEKIRAETERFKAEMKREGASEGTQGSFENTMVPSTSLSRAEGHEPGTIRMDGGAIEIRFGPRPSIGKGMISITTNSLSEIVEKVKDSLQNYSFQTLEVDYYFLDFATRFFVIISDNKITEYYLPQDLLKKVQMLLRPKLLGALN